jgi:hypothetical protein
MKGLNIGPALIYGGLWGGVSWAILTWIAFFDESLATKALSNVIFEICFLPVYLAVTINSATGSPIFVAIMASSILSVLFGAIIGWGIGMLVED